VLALTILVLGAAGASDPEELVRQANAAFERQEFDVAVKLYTEAERTIGNPGLVAFNKGAALYRLNRFHEAQLHYERCLEEAAGPRRAAMLYNLGNCLLQQAQNTNDLALFRTAVKTFSDCLGHEGAEAELQQNARHNLELAKLLWLQARLRANSKDPEAGDQPNPTKPPPPDKGPPQHGKGEEGPDPLTGANPKAVPEKDKKAQIDAKKGDKQPVPVDLPTPGQGNRPPDPPDKSKLEEVSPEDAVKRLETAVKLIRDERLRYRFQSAPVPPRDVPDW
jgi:tetratricopeptide (TPR) repeat protein